MVPERHVLVELGHFVACSAAIVALVPAPLEAERGRTEAQCDAQRAAARADSYHAGPDEPQLDRLKAFLTSAHERDDQTQRYRAQAHVQQRVGYRALLQFVQPPVRAVARERQCIVNLQNAAIDKRCIWFTCTREIRTGFGYGNVGRI